MKKKSCTFSENPNTENKLRTAPLFDTKSVQVWKDPNRSGGIITETLLGKISYFECKQVYMSCCSDSLTTIPNMWATAATRSCLLMSFLVPVCFSAITKLDTTGWGWLRNRSSTSMQERILWGKVPPMTASLPAMVSNTTPTSPIAPHWMATPENNHCVKGFNMLLSNKSFLLPIERDLCKASTAYIVKYRCENVMNATWQSFLLSLFHNTFHHRVSKAIVSLSCITTPTTDRGEDNKHIQTVPTGVSTTGKVKVDCTLYFWMTYCLEGLLGLILHQTIFQHLSDKRQIIFYNKIKLIRKISFIFFVCPLGLFKKYV